MTWTQHKGRNQWFVVNKDLTISPTAAPNRVWGLRESDKRLILVKKGDENQLVFHNLPIPFQDKKTLKLAPSNFPGKAIIITTVQNHGFGMQ